MYRNAGLAKVQTAPEGSLVPITISLQFDAFPDDIEVILRCEDATVAAFGRNTFSVPNELVVDTFRVPKAAKCQFTITDALSNGMCRSDGKGFYRVYYGNNTTNSSNILAQGGQLFGSREEVAFTSSPPLPALVPVTIVLQLDNHANEVAVFFHCGETIKSEAPLRSFTQDAGGLVSSTFFVEEGAECKFEIRDNSYDDFVNGLCCFFGYGFTKFITVMIPQIKTASLPRVDSLIMKMMLRSSFLPIQLFLLRDLFHSKLLYSWIF